MGKKYTFSRSITNSNGEKEVFTAVEYDSFEEARTAVSNGIRDRKLEEVVPGATSGLTDAVSNGIREGEEMIVPDITLPEGEEK